MSWVAVGSAAVGGAFSLGASTLGGKGGATSNLPSAQYYQPTGQGAADTQLQGFFNNYQNPYAALSGYNTNYLNASQANPYAAGAQNFANQAGLASNSAAYNDYSAGLKQQNTGLQGLDNVNYQLGNIYNNPYGGSMVSGAQAGGQGLSTTGQNSLAAAGQLPGLAQNSLGGLQGLAQGYANPLQGYAQMTAGQLPGLAQNLTQGIMPQAYGNANTLNQAGGQILNTAFDPQHQLYNQQFQQNQDQTRAGLAARGLNRGGVGAGIENQSNQDFNTNWQNQQLGRQQAGLNSYSQAAGQALGGLETGSASTYNPIASGLGQGLGALNTSATTGYGIQAGAANQYLSGLQSAYGAADALGTSGGLNMISGAQAPYAAQNQITKDQINNLGQLGNAAGVYGQGLTGGAGLLNQGVQGYANAGALPYDTSQGILGNQYGGLSNYLGLAGQGQNYNQQMMGSLANYLGLGNNAAQGFTNAQNSAYGQNQNNLQGIGNLIGGLTPAISKLFSGGGSNAASGSYGGNSWAFNGY